MLDQRSAIYGVRVALQVCLAAAVLSGGIARGGHLDEGAVYSTESSRARFEVGVGTWVSLGGTKWDHDASAVDPTLGNPTSELEYKDTRSIVAEVQGRMTYDEWLFVQGSGGYGGIDDGTLIDDDYVSALGATTFGTSVSGAHRVSRTESDIDGDYLWYVNLDVGMTLFRFSENRGAIRTFLGYQHWREQYTGRGVYQVECTAVGTLCSAPGTVAFAGTAAITNKVDWDSLRLGAETDVLITRWLTLWLSAAYVPFAALSNEDTHHLRTDLQQDPSFSMTGTGQGYDLEAGARVRVLENLYVHAGARYWDRFVNDGEWRNHPVAGASSTLNLNKLRTQRYGFTFHISHTF